MTTQSADDSVATNQPDAEFWKAFGAGQRKANNKERKLKVDGVDLVFTIATLEKVQQFIDAAVAENLRLNDELDETKRQLDEVEGRSLSEEKWPPRQRTDGALVVKRRRGRPRKNPLPKEDLVLPAKPRYRVPANSFRSAA
jgi:hypothetical protein